MALGIHDERDIFMKKLLSVALMLILALSCFSLTAFAAEDAQVTLTLDEGIDNLINYDVYPFAEAESYILFLDVKVPDGCTARYYRNGKVIPESEMKTDFIEGSVGLKLKSGNNTFQAAAVDASGKVVEGSLSKPIKIFGEEYEPYNMSFTEGLQTVPDADLIARAREGSGHEKVLARQLLDYDETTGVNARSTVRQSIRQNIGWNSYARRIQGGRTASGYFKTDYFVDGEIQSDSLRLVVALAKQPSDTVVGDPFIIGINKDGSIDVNGISTRFVGTPNVWNNVKAIFHVASNSSDVYINDVLIAKGMDFHADIGYLYALCVHGFAIDPNLYYDDPGAGYTKKLGDLNLVREAINNMENSKGPAVMAEFNGTTTTVTVNKDDLLKGFRTDLIAGVVTKEGEFFVKEFDCNRLSKTPLTETFVVENEDVDRVIIWRKSDMSVMKQIGNPVYYQQ